MKLAFSNIRHHLLVLVLAAFVALSAAYTPVMLDAMAGSAITAAAYACTNSSGGC